jgi:uncharacterized protein YdaU (DUF1376 family)
MSLPRMSLHIGDYLKDTRHLRAAEHGAYMLLIMHYWATGGLPDDDRQLAAITCMSDREWKKARPVIEAFFAPGWKHGRIDRELQEANERYERRASAGKKGGNARAMVKQCSSNATPMLKQPITNNPKEDDHGEDAGARPPLVSPEASRIADEVARLSGIGEPLDWPPGWCGAPMRVQAWLAQGWTEAPILAAVRGAIAKKRDGPPHSIQYFERPIAKLIAEQAAPLPNVVTLPAQTIEVRSHGKPETLPDTARRLAASGTTFGPRPGSLCAPTGGNDVRMLPAGGCERPGDVHSGDSVSSERIRATRD